MEVLPEPRKPARRIVGIGFRCSVSVCGSDTCDDLRAVGAVAEEDLEKAVATTGLLLRKAPVCWNARPARLFLLRRDDVCDKDGRENADESLLAEAARDDDNGDAYNDADARHRMADREAAAIVDWRQRMIDRIKYDDDWLGGFMIYDYEDSVEIFDVSLERS